MKKYKLTEKGMSVVECIVYIITTGLSAILLFLALVVLGIYILTLAGYNF